MAHRHLANLVLNSNLDGIKNRYGKFLNGSFYTAQNGYDGPGVGMYHNMYPIGLYDLCKEQNETNCGAASGWPVSSGQAGWHAAADQWVSHFSNPANGLEKIHIFKYMIDEPYYVDGTDGLNGPKAQWALSELITLATWVHTNPGVGKDLETFCTVIPDNKLIGNCDVWSSPQNFNDLNFIRARQAEGYEYGTYNGDEPWLGQGIGALDVNNTNARMVPWAVLKYNLDHYYLWETTYMYNPEFLYPRYANIFQETPLIGAALLFYPGNDKQYPAESRAGKSAEVENLLAAGVKRAFSDVGTAADQADPAPNWYQYGYQYEATRKQVAQLLDGTTTPAPTPSATPNSGKLGDIISNNCVDIYDYSALLRSYGSKPGDAGYLPAANLNSNPVVDLFDYSLLLEHFEGVCTNS
jgi:hypothetical protein